MDGKTGDESNGPAKIHKAGLQITVGIHKGHPTRQGQVPVEPGVEQSTAVHINTQLHYPGACFYRMGLDRQIGAIGMGAYHAQAILGSGAAGTKGNDGAVIGGDEVARAGLKGGFVQPLQVLETRLFQAPGQSRDRMERRRGLVQKGY